MFGAGAESFSCSIVFLNSLRDFGELGESAESHRLEEGDGLEGRMERERQSNCQTLPSQ
jgi:hypothetical protein